MLMGLSVGLTSCSDPMDEITSLILDRNFSPVDLEARVQQRTNIRLNWTLSSGADQYVIEQYDNDSLMFDGVSPSQTYTIGSDQVPYTVTGLDGETPYSFRVKAVTSTDGSRDSKWSEVYAKTSAEQILQALGDDDVKARSVTLKWQAGETAQNIVIRDGKGTTVVDHALTQAEISAGTVTIGGLTPETSYIATMYRASGKQRGSVSFTTAIELLDGDVLVKTGDDIAQAVADAKDGARLIIMPGTYVIAPDASSTAEWGVLAINKSITFKGLRENDHPVIEGRFAIAGGADITFDQVTLKGDQTSGDQAFNVTEATKFNSLSVTNSEISGYNKGLIYINVAAEFSSITFNNNVISNVKCDGGDFIDSRKGAFHSLSFTNNTVYNSCLERDFIRYDDASKSFAGVSPVITIDHNTLNGVGNASDGSRRILYVRFKGNSIKFTNNIVTNTEASFSNQKNTAVPTFSGNVYYNTPNLQTATQTSGKGLFYDNDGTVTNPQYKDASNGDFTVGNEDVKFAGAGDPRWLK